jgi:hypothetical protein
VNRGRKEVVYTQIEEDACEAVRIAKAAFLRELFYGEVVQYATDFACIMSYAEKIFVEIARQRHEE